MDANKAGGKAFGSLEALRQDTSLGNYVRGAFTGANQARQGLLASAAGGTVFLDEVAELPVDLQAKLLRVLQEHEVRPIGGNERLHLEARVVAATFQDVDMLMEGGSLRKDLYFRLNVFRITLPPLRDRKSDIPALAEYFLRRHGGEGQITTISDDVMKRLMNYHWPGNVRELENCILRAQILGTGRCVKAEDVPSPLFYRKLDESSGRKILPLRDLKRNAIDEALKAAAGNRVRAAKILGIGKTTIYRKLMKL